MRVGLNLSLCLPVSYFVGRGNDYICLFEHPFFFLSVKDLVHCETIVSYVRLGLFLCLGPFLLFGWFFLKLGDYGTPHS